MIEYIIIIFILAIPVVPILIVWGILGNWVEEKNIRKERKGILFAVVNITCGLVLFSTITFVFLSYNEVEIFKDEIKDTIELLSELIIPHIEAPYIPLMLMYILFFVMLCASGLFFITRAILGRQTRLSNTFWEHKKLAKSKILWCNMLCVITLFLIFLTAFACFGLIFCAFESDFRESILAQNLVLSLFLAFIVMAIVLGVFVFKNFSFRTKSINKLAKTLEATEILEHQNLSLKERMLLNIVSEMALASSCPQPRVFVLKEEQGINAMCSVEYVGKKNEKIAIFVTQGALKLLKREELQGVIGHEFSHIFHRDIALNFKILALIFALNCVMIAGIAMVTSMSKKRGYSNSQNNNKEIPLFLVAVVFFVLGFAGMILAQIIQAAISRQKEFLADASSVQYTRNPLGLKSALQKIAQKSDSYRDKEGAFLKELTYLKNPKASFCAHMFFLPCSATMFATHPPLEERIAHLEQMGANA